MTPWLDLPAGMPTTAAVIGFQHYLATHPDAGTLAGLYVDWLRDGVFHATRIERVVRTAGSARRHAADILVPAENSLAGLEECAVECRRAPIAELRQSEFILPVVRHFFDLLDRVRAVPPERWNALARPGGRDEGLRRALGELQRHYRAAYAQWTEDFTLGFVDEPLPANDVGHGRPELRPPSPWEWR